jgi:hypothetical protein
MKWFHKSQTWLPQTPTEYPAGTFIETEAGYFYIVNSAKRYRITTTRCLASWRPHRVVKTTEAAVKRYRISSKLKFRNGSLIWNISDGRIYLIENGLRCWVKNPEWFRILGLDPADLKFNMDKVMCVSQADLNLHEIGEDLN